MIKSFIHLFQVVPSIQKGNEGFVHHLLMFECDGNFTEEHFNQGVECSRRTDNNSSYPECISSTLIATWAVGGEVKKNNQVLCQRLIGAFDCISVKYSGEKQCLWQAVKSPFNGDRFLKMAITVSL